ncbi:MAG: electron transport complex subunit RsxC [Spongiibacteraceae bacterium]
MKLFSLRGGVHPDSHKDLTADRPIAINLPIPERLYIPLRQHAGAEARPAVRVGDRVLKGQRIAAGGAEVSAPLHASTSGKIIAIDDVAAPHPSGLKAPAIIIEADGEDRWFERDDPIDPFSLEPEQIDQHVLNAGVVGLGGALFPAIVKLRLGRKRAINTLILNGSECEPYLTADDRIMRERSHQIVDGARIMRHITKSTNIVIAIENNKPQAIAAMRAAAEMHGMITVVAVPAIYPMGSAEQLIRAVVGHEVPANARSADTGVLVHNVATAFAVHQAFRESAPLISRIVTIGGECVTRPQNVEALIGTPIKHLFDYCGGFRKPAARLVMGGPMMGQILPHDDVPLIKGASGLLALSQAEVQRDEAAPCIRCARCVDACPMGLMPLEMANHARSDDFSGAQKYGLDDCILCGSCAFVCPSHIPLVQYFQYARGEIWSRENSERKNALTKTLMEQRQQRVEAEAAAKAAAKSQKRRKSSEATAEQKADVEESAS